MKTWLKNMKIRQCEVTMLHISLGVYTWLPMDAWYVLTGRV